MRSNACSLSLSLPNSSSHISFTIGAGLCPLARCRTMFHESSGFSMGYRGFSGWIYIAPSFSMSSETNRILRAIPSPLLTICILQLRPASKALAQTNAFFLSSSLSEYSCNILLFISDCSLHFLRLDRKLPNAEHSAINKLPNAIQSEMFMLIVRAYLKLNLAFLSLFILLCT